MKRNLQQQIDHLLELPTSEVLQQLQSCRNTNQQNFTQLCEQIKHLVLNETQSMLSFRKLVLLQSVCQLEGQKYVDAGCFKCGNVYQLAAVAQGYMKNGPDVKGNFIRNLKRTPLFWGTTSIQNIYQALISKAAPVLLKPIDIQSKLYLWMFIKNNQELFPSNFDYYQYAVKHMLMLRTDRKEELEVFNIVMDVFSKYSHSYQIMSKNFRFVLQFFKTPLSEKELGYFPCQVAKRLLNIYPVYQVDNIFAIGSLGLSWSEADVLNCINNVLKLGITESTYRLFKSFIEMFKRLKKYTELVQAFEKNIHKIFIFLKYPQLYAASLKTLKEFILGPWPISTLYNSFAIKATQFAKTKNLSQNKDFILLISCVIEKYKQSTIVSDLEELVKPFCVQEISPQKIRTETLEYDWRVFEKINRSGKDKNKEEVYENRGFVNIGNSCYMNSFLQSLYMTKEYRRTVLETSTLNVEKTVLIKLEKLHQQTKEARETVRPLAELQRTFSLLLKSKRAAINPSNIKKISPPQFQNMNQHDCIEFGRFLIETISRSIEHVFEGEITTEIECPFCGARRQKAQQFLDLMLSSATNQDTDNIESMVRASLEDEYLEDLKCEACNNVSQQQKQQEEITKKKEIPQKPQNMETLQKNEVQQDSKMDEQPTIKKSIKRHWISKYPNYLILTLKRFEYNIKQNKNVKKQYKLDLAENVKINNVEYLIYAFIVHRGVSANSGHYFTFARMSYQQDVKDWLCLNDATVTKLDQFSKVIEFLNVNQEDTPYIIFCIKKEYWEEHQKKLQQPLTLRAPLQSFIEKDDAEYLKQLSKKGSNVDLSMLKFATGNFYRKDDDDNGPGSGMGGFNNPIM